MDCIFEAGFATCHRSMIDMGPSPDNALVHARVHAGPPKTPIGCKIRGYRKLSGDFQGNVISTGFLQKWSSAAGEIQTGPISPGVANEYDILTCRDQEVTSLSCLHALPFPLPPSLSHARTSPPRQAACLSRVLVSCSLLSLCQTAENDNVSIFRMVKCSTSD